MKELIFKYGCNPNQLAAKMFMRTGAELPLDVLNGNPGYINLMDALNAWQLVSELKSITNSSAAASFKHVSPSGAAISGDLNDDMKKAYQATMSNDYSPIANAYIRARGSDRLSSYGDFIAISDECDESLARYLALEFSDGIIAPSYSKDALEILKKKHSGKYIILKIDADYFPEQVEYRDLFGITLQQERNSIDISYNSLTNIPTVNKKLTDTIKKDLLIAMLTLKYTQSNSICFVKDGQTIGVGAGQQSRINCTKIAGDKANKWHYRFHEKVINLKFLPNLKKYEIDNAIEEYIMCSKTMIQDDKWKAVLVEKPQEFTDIDKYEYLKKLSGVSLASDGFFPFNDSIERAYQSGVQYIAQPGGSIRDDVVIKKCDEYSMIMALTGVRLFYH